MTPRLSSLWTAVVLAGCLNASAAEPVKDAAQLFDEGKGAYARGEYRAAALAFEEASRLAPRGASFYDAGLAWEAAKENARAANALERALQREDMPKDLQGDATARLTQLARTLGVLEVTGAPGTLVSVAFVERAPVPLHLYLPPGPYVLRATDAWGHLQQREVTISSVESVRWQVPNVDLLAAAVRSTRFRTAGFSLLIGAAVTTVAAGTLGVATLGARNDFIASQQTSSSARTSAVSLRTWTNVAWGATAALGISGAAILLWHPNAEPHLSVTLALGPNAGTLVLSFTH